MTYHINYIKRISGLVLSTWFLVISSAGIGQELGQHKVVFSPAELDESHLAKAKDWIDQAETSIDIAMYSMRPTRIGILDSLEAAVLQGVKVRMILEKASKDRKNPEGSFSSRMEDLGIDVRYINKIMHHKFAIIDATEESFLPTKNRLISGSANWTSSAAQRFDDNTLFFSGQYELSNRFSQEFDSLWNHSRDFVWQDFSESISRILPISEENPTAVDQNDFDVFFTSANFQKVDLRAGPGFRTIYGVNTVSRAIVAAIESAKTSIKVASGHLRSKLIAEALLRKKQEAPGVDIQVILDNQKFISAYYDAEQKREIITCEREARTDRQRQKCTETGIYYSYDLVRAGIYVRFKAYAYRWHYSYAPQMHHKYMVIDQKVVLTGSFNYSDNAENNTMENLMVLRGDRFEQLADDFIENHETMWSSGRNLIEGLNEQISSADSFPIVFEPMALSWQELSDLKKLIRENCSAINSHDFRRKPEAHRVCYR